MGEFMGCGASSGNAQPPPSPNGAPKADEAPVNLKASTVPTDEDSKRLSALLGGAPVAGTSAKKVLEVLSNHHQAKMSRDLLKPLDLTHCLHYSEGSIVIEAALLAQLQAATKGTSRA